MDDRRFDHLTRRLGNLTLPALPRRLALRAFGGVALASIFGLGAALDDAAARRRKRNKDRKKDRDKDRDKDKDKDRDDNSRCKDEGQKCDKKKCKQRGKKCCCDDLKCKNDRCKGKGGNDCPLRVNADETWTTFDSTDGPDTFNNPWGIATDVQGNVYVTDRDNERVLVFDSGGSLDDEFGQQGTSDNDFQLPSGIVFNEDSNRIFVLDPGQTSSRRFRRFSFSGGHEENLGEDLSEPNGIAVDPNGRIWVVDTAEEIVLRYDSDGETPGIFEPGGNGVLDRPEGIAVYQDEDDDATYVYVADTGNDRIVKFEFVNTGSNGLAFRDEAGSPGDNDDEFNQPVGIAVDECGNLWIADRLNNRIQILDKNLRFISRFTHSFNRPVGVALSSNGKKLFVTDSDNDRVRVYDLTQDSNRNRARASGADLIQD